jgi:dimethylargininase
MIMKTESSPANPDRVAHTITRKPCTRFSEGITTANLGVPDYQLALQQHVAYINALKSCGLEVIELEADENFPDSCFVEDVAVIANEVAVITNPGAAARNAETALMIPVLQQFRKLDFIQSPGTLEGGDVIQIEKHFYIGLTERTNEAGAHQLGKILSQFGYSYSVVRVTTALHLKSVVNYVGNNNLLVSKEFYDHSLFSSYNKILVSDSELYACNCLLINGKLIIPKGFENVKTQLLKLNYDLIELNMSEFEKMDGGLTCLSLRFT